MPALPTAAPFDIYNVAAGAEMTALLTYTGVTAIETGSQITIDGPTGDIVMTSTSGVSTADAAIFMSVNVPESWTFQVNILETLLPINFSNLVNSHVFLGSSDPSGNCAGIFISKIGLAYTGSVHFDGLGNLVVDTPVQQLPDSQLIVEEGQYWTIRIATDYERATTYIYVTLTSELAMTGHQLRYVLPAIKSTSAATTPADETIISVRGTSAAGTIIQLDTLALGTGLIIPNIPPVSNPGVDQSVRTCSIAQLDGSASFDPDGSNLTYDWRMLDAPLGSQYIFDGFDGITYPLSPTPTGFTNLFHSVSLQALNLLTPIVSGTVLIVGGDSYNITGTGTDGNGFYAEIDGFDLPDSLPSVAFKLLYQNGISNPTSVKPTFYPDVPGIFKFDLIVNDGDLFSIPEEMIVNVTESPIPRGCIPDLSFLWNYLSDFWKLLEDPERINTFWSALAQIAAGELLNLWQIEYSKSLRDIQRTWQRKWLRYQLSMFEDPNFITSSTVRAIYGGVSFLFPVAGGSGINGTFIDITIPQQGASGVTYRLSFYGGASFTSSQVANQIAGQLQAINTGFSVQQIEPQSGTNVELRIDAPFFFSIAGTTTFPYVSVGDTNGVPQGTAGTLAGTNSYKVEQSLQGTPVQSGDFLILDSTAYRIVQVTTDASDAFPFQRVITSDPIAIGAPATWYISGQTKSGTLNFWTGLVTQGDIVTFEILQNSNGQLSYVTVPALGASSVVPGTLGVDTSLLGYYLAQPAGAFSVYFFSVLRRQYIPVDPLVVDVPTLQEIINNKDDTQVLRRNVDYFIQTFRDTNSFQFVVGTNDVWQGGAPPDHMWAEMTYLDNRPTIEANFGIPAEFTLDDLSQLPSNVDYLSSVQGLWYAYLYGSTVFNLRVGTQILLGLPFAEVAGTITEIRDDFSTTTGRILVQDTANAEIVRSYTFPASLSLEVNPATGVEYVVGDSVAQFAPLVTGVEVLDYINSPKWYGGYVEQGSFVEVQKYFTFLVRANSAAFNLKALLYVQNFVRNIKPTYTSPIFVVEEDVGDTDITTTDSIGFSGTLHLNEGPCTHGPPWGRSGMFDQPRPSGGGWWNQFDSDGVDTPTFPTPTEPSPWAYDKETNCPEYFAMATTFTAFAGGTFAYDSGFPFDLPFFTASFASFGSRSISGIPGSGEDGYSMGQWNVTSGGSAIWLYSEIDGWNGGQSTFYIDIYQNGTLAQTVTFTKGNGTRDKEGLVVSITVSPGDLMELKVRSTGVNGVSLFWHDALFVLADGVTWEFDMTTISAGTYEVYRSI